MDASAPFVVRGEFVYHGTLFVDVGGALKRHARASQSDLKTYLDGKAPKDQVAHWYEAQLIHYGLPRSKDKNTAKVRLQQALSQKKLTVPPHIVDMEVQMKKDYAASIRKSRAPTGKVDQGLERDDGPTNKKRKRTDANVEPSSAANKKTKITMKIGDVEVAIDHDTSGAKGKSKQTKTTPSSSATAAASSPAKGKAKSAPASKAIPKTPATPRAKKTQTTGVTSPYFSQGLPNSTASPASSPQKRAVKPESKIKQEPSASQRTPAKRPPKIKAEAKPEAEDVVGQRFITGVYNVSSPQLEAQYAHEANNLRFFLCVDNEARKIWGGFELVSKSGVICIPDDYNNPYATLSFGWRARDVQRGGLDFGRGCFGRIDFSNDGRFSATVFNMFPEPVELEGVRRAGPLWCGKSAWQFEREWDGFVAEAYGR